MTAFRSEFDIHRAAKAAGLQRLAGEIAATARPALLFLRRQQPDDPLPPGTSKHGGLPDLPADFPWPERPACLDADAREDAILRQGETLRDFLRSRGLSRPEQEASKERHDALLIEALRRPFPLAFRAQLDLGALSVEAGFDADLPKHGALSIFEDLTGDGSGAEVRAFWHDAPAQTLVRRDCPPEIVALSDAADRTLAWAALTMAEVLEPRSALTVPHHWMLAPGTSGNAILNFLSDSGHEVDLDAGIDMREEHAGNFGDRLGGWPRPIQQDPETELWGGRPGSIRPGDDRIRHLFSWGAEYYGGTRLPNNPEAETEPPM